MSDQLFDYMIEMNKTYRCLHCNHQVTFTHSNGAIECISCNLLRVKDTPEMREIYDHPQFRVIWKKGEEK